jgi:hypothetical protein
MLFHFQPVAEHSADCVNTYTVMADYSASCGSDVRPSPFEAFRNT